MKARNPTLIKGPAFYITLFFRFLVSFIGMSFGTQANGFENLAERSFSVCDVVER